MGLITVQGIRLYAYHGHLPEEAKLGGHFIVSVWVTVDTSEVEKTDNLKHTVDYVKIIEIVKEQMEIRSDMIEVPAKRILDAILPLEKVQKVQKVSIFKSVYLFLLLYLEILQLTYWKIGIKNF